MGYRTWKSPPNLLWVPMITVLPAFLVGHLPSYKWDPSLPRGKRGGCYYVLKWLVGTICCTFNAVVTDEVELTLTIIENCC